MKTQKKNKTLGRGKPAEITATYIPGAVIIDDMESAVEMLELMEEAEESIAPVVKFISEARKAATEYAKTSDVTVIQLEGRYWRKIQRFSRFFVATWDDMPDPKPKGAKPLREIVTNKKGPNGKPLWNFITRRVPDKGLIDSAVKKGFITEKELGKAYIEAPQAVFIQRFEGEAVEEDDD